MYDPLWENHPKVKKIRAESKAEALQGAVVTIVKARFPALTELAQEKVAQIDTPEVLNYLLGQIAAEPHEDVVRALLRPTVA